MSILQLITSTRLLHYTESELQNMLEDLRDIVPKVELPGPSVETTEFSSSNYIYKKMMKKKKFKKRMSISILSSEKTLEAVEEETEVEMEEDNEDNCTVDCDLPPSLECFTKYDY
uniref:Uncharacterized protein n=1 Tax=Caenorhabditis japonica TaxID=281687 RepID=A0A8R1EBZ4_CAEJA